MSTRAVIIWLTLAVVLGIAVILLVWTPSWAPKASGVIPVGAKIMDFSPGEVTRITVQQSGETARQVIERPSGGKGTLGADADWQLRIEPANPGETTASPWPLEPARVQSLLRVLSETRALALPARDAELGQPTRVTLRIGSSDRAWLLAERTLAGTGLIELDGPPGTKASRAIVSDQIHNVFTSPGPRGWRQRLPAAGIDPDASRITVESAGKTLLLARSDGRWALREPVNAPADPAGVQRLLNELSRIQIADFLDEGPKPNALSVDKATSRITIEADRRAVAAGTTDAKITTDVLTISVGGAADAAASRLTARVQDRLVLLDSRSLADIHTDPTTYVWPHPVRISPGDIASITVTPAATSANPAARTFKRGPARWTRLASDGSPLPLSDPENREVESLLSLLTGGGQAGLPKNPASQPLAQHQPAITLAAPDGYAAAGTITLGSLSGQPLESIELGFVGDKLAAFRTGRVFRSYPIGQVPQILLDVSAAAQPAPQPGVQKPEEPNK